MKTLQVNEIFGPTVQGEGAGAGRHCLFVRLAQCNLQCHWCDTPYTWAYTPEKADAHITGKMWDKEAESTKMTYLEVMTKLQLLYSGPTTVVWSGGEPMMQQDALELCADILQLHGYHNHIETAGTIKPKDHVVRVVQQFNVSPKLEHSRNPLKKRYKKDVLKAFVQTGKAYFKFVVEETSQLEEVDVMVRECNIPRDRVQIMPEGIGSRVVLERAKNLAPAVLRRGYGLSLRNHILLWEDERGV
jgi:7-carboxy-7-deazaguanine synthase